MTTIAAKTRDAPMPIGDAADVLFTIPADVPVELRTGPNGTTLVVRKATTDAAGRPTRATLELMNREGLARILAGSGAQP